MAPKQQSLAELNSTSDRRDRTAAQHVTRTKDARAAKVDAHRQGGSSSSAGAASPKPFVPLPSFGQLPNAFNLGAGVSLTPQQQAQLLQTVMLQQQALVAQQQHAAAAFRAPPKPAAGHKFTLVRPGQVAQRNQAGAARGCVVTFLGAATIGARECICLCPGQ